jgi:hypothetical protein
MPHNPASIVRLLYGERSAEDKTAPKRFLLTPASNCLTSVRHIGQGRHSRMPEMVSVTSKPISGSRSRSGVPRDLVSIDYFLLSRQSGNRILPTSIREMDRWQQLISAGSNRGLRWRCSAPNIHSREWTVPFRKPRRLRPAAKPYQ